MKNYFKFIFTVVIFTTSLILLNQKSEARKKVGTLECNTTMDDLCTVTNQGNTLIGRYIEMPE
jgi:hypothetical protein